ncbi:pilus assembly protein TadG-related protein [Cellulomonas sp.]|uniref:pilus assembly protein TadG-related protein n=1 Tax=Cellulomonas sp. TaxID=40001 RepID=UPI0025BBEEEC|nr:pilus assembly protein TadG-related protein [Cellulomonas sp.]
MTWRGRGRTSRASGTAKDDGQIMILTIGFVAIALLLVTVVASATAVHLERKRLLALADLVALESADALAEQGYFPDGSGQAGLPLSDSSVRAAVDDYLRDNPAAAQGLHDLTVLSATTPDGRSAEVRLGATARPVLLSWVLAPWSDGIALEAESVARAS